MPSASTKVRDTPAQDPAYRPAHPLNMVLNCDGALITERPGTPQGSGLLAAKWMDATAWICTDAFAGICCLIASARELASSSLLAPSTRYFQRRITGRPSACSRSASLTA